jgi:hypothetical protein
MRKTLLFGLLACLTLSPSIFARDIVSIQTIRSADGAVVDTIYQGYDHQFHILIENGFNLGGCGLTIPLQIYSPDGVAWTWRAQPDGYPGDGLQAVTVIPGCRIDPPLQVFDLTGLIVDEIDVAGGSPDTIAIGGVSLFGGLDSGPLEPMIALHFIPENITEDGGTICVDTFHVAPYQLFFCSASGESWPAFDGPFCWPVVEYNPILGDFDLDGVITVGDPVEIVKYIFHGKPHFAPVETGDVNCDGELNVGDALFLIQYIFMHGPPPGCK